VNQPPSTHSDVIDGPALARALDAFVEAYGHRITWNEVLPIVRAAVYGTTPVDGRLPAGEFAHRFEESDQWPS
jgi:hypothetical protein